MSPVDYQWRPEEYFEEGNAVPNEHQIIGVERILFQWMDADRDLEVPAPVRCRSEKDTVVYFNHSGNEYRVRRTWDVMITVKKGF
jgi:hypothetical protein